MRPGKLSAVADLSRLEQVAQARRRVCLLLSIATVVVYVGFILSVAFAKRFMGATLVPGLSFGVLFGALVIVAAFALTGVYARWANRNDAALSSLRRERP